MRAVVVDPARRLAGRRRTLGDARRAVGVAGQQHERGVVAGLGAQVDLRHGRSLATGRSRRVAPAAAQVRPRRERQRLPTTTERPLDRQLEPVMHEPAAEPPIRRPGPQASLATSCAHRAAVASAGGTALARGRRRQRRCARSGPEPSRSARQGGGATVNFEHVTKRYDPGAKGPGAVNDLSFTVPAGKICVLVGPSGCGKTTSLKMVNRLIEPTSGRILIDGVDAATRDVTELRRRHRLRHPAGGPVPAPDHRRERGRRAAPAGLVGGSPARARGRAAGAGRPRSRAATAAAIPASCRAASASASAWPGRWPPTRR